MNPLIEEEDPGLALEVYDPSLERDYVRRIKVELLRLEKYLHALWKTNDMLKGKLYK